MGVRFRARTELCARKEDFGSGENGTVCAEEMGGPIEWSFGILQFSGETSSPAAIGSPAAI